VPNALHTPIVDLDTAVQARRYLGSRDAAQALGLTEDQLRKLAPGPSRTPLIVEEVAKGGNRADLTEKFLRELGIEP
jgi:hypothetical protein